MAQDPETFDLDALYDFRKVENVTLSSNAVRKLADACSREPNTRKIALVAGGGVVYGMGRMFQTRVAEQLPDLRVFRRLDPALEYLGLA